MNKNDFPCTVLRERNDNDDMMIPIEDDMRLRDEWWK